MAGVGKSSSKEIISRVMDLLELEEENRRKGIPFFTKKEASQKLKVSIRAIELYIKQLKNPENPKLDFIDEYDCLKGLQANEKGYCLKYGNICEFLLSIPINEFSELKVPRIEYHPLKPYVLENRKLVKELEQLKKDWNKKVRELKKRIRKNANIDWNQSIWALRDIDEVFKVKKVDCRLQ